MSTMSDSSGAPHGPHSPAGQEPPHDPPGALGGSGAQHLVLPGVPDDLDLAVPTGPSPEDPVGVRRLAYAVHADQLASTRHYPEGPGRQPCLDGDTVELIQAALRLTGSLRVPEALRRLVESACSLTGAAWGTIAVLSRADAASGSPTGSAGTTVSSGAPTASPDELERLAGKVSPTGPQGSDVVIDNDLSGAAAFTGAIEGEEAGNLLSAPLRVHGQVYGRIYLCDKPGGFGPSDVDSVMTLAEAAAVAVENARLYREARDREQWMSVSQELTTLLLSGAEEDDALTHIARRVREVAHADTAALILPSVAETWICEIADGEHAQDLIGTFFPPEGRALTTLTRRTGMVVRSLAAAWERDDLRLPQLAQFGPALYAPMIHRGRGVGVMLLLRA